MHATGWAHPPNAHFAHWFDAGRAVCTSGLTWYGEAVFGLDAHGRRLPGPTPSDACAQCAALLSGGVPPHEHEWIDHTTPSDRERVEVCRCGARRTGPFPDVEVSTVDDLANRRRVYLTHDGFTRQEQIPDDEWERMTHR